MTDPQTPAPDAEEVSAENEESSALETPETAPEETAPDTKPEASAEEVKTAEEPGNEQLETSIIFEKFEKKGRQPSQGRNWYAVHTYSGYEEAVKKALEQRIETLGMQDKIFSILVPTETEVQMRRGKPVEVKKCLFPGYVLVDMIVTDDSWYVVRNTPNVTGFVGSGNIPVPVTPEEFGIVQGRIGSSEPKFKADFKKGDVVRIMKGPFATFEGKVDAVDTGKGKLTVLVTVFDRETPVELDFDQISKK